jgi:hypothetical protein
MEYRARSDERRSEEGRGGKKEGRGEGFHELTKNQHFRTADLATGWGPIPIVICQ